MKKIKINIIHILLIISFVCCHNNKDQEYFNGNIQDVDLNLKTPQKVSSKIITLEGSNHGLIAVYDSLLVCWNPKLPNHFFNIFNLETGKEIGSFISKGQGPQEVISVNCIFQFSTRENDITTLLNDPYENKLLIWNISKSIRKGETILDTIMPFTRKRKNWNRSYNFLFLSSENTLLAYSQSDFLNENEVTTPLYEKRDLYTDELLQEYPIYKKESISNAKISPNFFFYSWDAIKPDGTKIVQAMSKLPQINIIDIQTGHVTGYRLPKSPDFSFVEKNTPLTNEYYSSVQADNHFIYATYWGKKQWGTSIDDKIPDFHTIHIFDWSGNLIRELQTDRVFFRIWLDPIQNRLYTQNHDTDEVYYIDLNELNLK